MIFFERKDNLSALVKFLQDIDSNQKIFAKTFYSVEDTTSNISVARPPFKSFNSTFTKPFAPVGVTVIALALSIVTRTYLDPIDVFIVVRKRPIFQQEKDCHNNLGLYDYCGKVGHIVIDHRNSALLFIKR